MKIMIPSRRHLSAVRGHLVMLYYLVHCILVLCICTICICAYVIFTLLYLFM